MSSEEVPHCSLLHIGRPPEKSAELGFTTKYSCSSHVYCTAKAVFLTSLPIVENCSVGIINLCVLYSRIYNFPRNHEERIIPFNSLSVPTPKDCLKFLVTKLGEGPSNFRFRLVKHKRQAGDGALIPFEGLSFVRGT